jgi:hypothetical protein
MQRSRFQALDLDALDGVQGGWFRGPPPEEEPPLPKRTPRSRRMKAASAAATATVSLESNVRAALPTGFASQVARND